MFQTIVAFIGLAFIVGSVLLFVWLLIDDDEDNISY